MKTAVTFHQQQGNDLLLHCLVQPKASRDEITGLQDERLKIRITAPPVDGKANTHLLRYLADVFELPRSSLSLEKGDTGRRKTIRILNTATLPEVILHSIAADNTR